MKPMWLWNNGLLAAADDLFGGGGGAGGSRHDDIDDDGDGDMTIDEDDLEDDDVDDDDDIDEEEEQPRKQRSSKASGFDATAFGKTFAETLAPHLRQPERQLTREEIETQLGKPKLTADLISALRDPEIPVEKALEMLGSAMNGMTDYALRAAGLGMQGKMQEFAPQIAAMQAHIQQRNTEDFVLKVLKKHPSLKGRGQVVRQAVQALSQSGYKPASASGAVKDVARYAARQIRTVDPNFSLKKSAGGGKALMRNRNSGGRHSNEPTDQRSKGMALVNAMFGGK